MARRGGVGGERQTGKVYYSMAMAMGQPVGLTRLGLRLRVKAGTMQSNVHPAPDVRREMRQSINTRQLPAAQTPQHRERDRR